MWYFCKIQSCVLLCGAESSESQSSRRRTIAISVPLISVLIPGIVIAIILTRMYRKHRVHVKHQFDFKPMSYRETQKEASMEFADDDEDSHPPVKDNLNESSGSSQPWTLCPHWLSKLLITSCTIHNCSCIIICYIHEDLYVYLLHLWFCI